MTVMGQHGGVPTLSGHTERRQPPLEESGGRMEARPVHQLGKKPALLPGHHPEPLTSSIGLTQSSPSQLPPPGPVLDRSSLATPK